MQETIIGGLIGLTSALIVGTLIPTINNYLNNKKTKYQLIIKLTSILYLLKNNVKSYLHQEMYKKIVSFTDDEDENRLSNLREQVSSNIYEIYSLQLEIVKYLKKRPLYSVEDIFENIDDLERFVWHTIINYNNDKEEFALESEKKYSNELSVMLESEMTTRIKRQIYINKISTNCKF